TPADALLDRVIVDHRGGDEELAAFVIVGDDGGDVGHVPVVVFQEDAAGADDAGGVTHAHRRDDARGAVHEQVGIHAAAEVPVAAPLREDRPIERHTRG